MFLLKKMTFYFIFNLGFSQVLTSSIETTGHIDNIGNIHTTIMVMLIHVQQLTLRVIKYMKLMEI